MGTRTPGRRDAAAPPPQRAARRRQAPGWWRDPDRRRAALLSGALHLSLFLLVISALRFPTPEPPVTYLVIDLGVPTFAQEVVEAATVNDPAPATPTPQVADTQVGQPQAATTPQPTPAATAPAPQTAQPEVPAAAPEAPEPVTVDAPRPPIPSPVRPAAAAAEVPLAALAATPLPEIALPDLQPTPLADRIPVPMPAVATVVPEPRAIAPTPQVTVSAAAPVPVPAVAAQVEVAAPVPIPVATVATSPGRPVAIPDVRADVGTAVDVRVAPQVQVSVAQPVPMPRVLAEVGELPTAPEAPRTDAGAATATATASARDDDVPAGGDAANPGQTGPIDPTATAQGAGAAASPDGEAVGTGTPAIPRAAFGHDLMRPLAVVIDNSGVARPSGINAVSMVVEMPVEATITRLLFIFDRTDPGRVGPVRSARPYFVELAARLDAVLVHDGGSPDALQAIDAAAAAPTINSFRSGALFSRGDGRAPYNLFSAGDALRAAVNRLDLAPGRTVSGTIYRPEPAAPEVTSVGVTFGGQVRRSTFEYQPQFHAYRWVREGTPALDAAGQQVQVDAVLVGQIEARVYPGDTQGRLLIPLNGGPATLYVAGQAVAGSWLLRDTLGVRFVTAGGEEVDLAPFRTWVALTPSYDARSETP